MDRSNADFMMLRDVHSNGSLPHEVGQETKESDGFPRDNGAPTGGNNSGVPGSGQAGGHGDPPAAPSPSDHDEGSEIERRALLNEPNEQFGDNTIRTSKYTMLSFIPRSLFEQFRRTANVYFLVISMLMIVGTYAPSVFQSPLQPYSTLGPLVLVLSITMIKEAVEDFKRHTSDKEVNYRMVSVLQPDGTETRVHWVDIRVGHIIRVVNKSEVPADIILLQTSEKQGMCYIETSNIDGETNLKIKEAVAGVARKYTSSNEIARIKGSLAYEQPNDSIHTFDGRLVVAGHAEAMPVAASNMVLRGCTLRNSAWVLGVVVFTGAETKVMKKSSSSRSKMSRIESTVNKCIGIIFLTQLILCIISTILERQWSTHTGSSADYLMLSKATFVIPEWLAQLLTFFILYNNFIPISLYVTIEMVNFAQALLIDKDASMYDPETDTPAKARTSNLNQDLGQVQYVFSDKTGTLTRNLMEFKICSIGGVKFGKLDEETIGTGVSQRSGNGAPRPSFNAPELVDIISGRAPPSSVGVGDISEIDDFFACMALCHTVVPEADERGGRAIYQAESPDEGALVGAARDLGYEFLSRTNDSLTISRHHQHVTYQLLGIHTFDATRKRMSMVFRTPDGRVVLYIKGADNVIMDRSVEGPHNDTLVHHLVDFAKLGLRTLVLAQRYLEHDEAERWLADYKRAANSIVDRAAKLAAVAELVERDLTVLGATAIEDKLQEGVPDTIDALARAGIKTWVLTGDKVETAINIGYSCKLLTTDMELIMLTQSDTAALEEKLLSVSAGFHPVKLRRPGALNRLREVINHQPKNSALLSGGTKPPYGATDAGKDRRASAVQQTQQRSLIVSGQALAFILGDDVMQEQFLTIAMHCKAVVACRVSPPQKASLVRMVRKHVPGAPVTLAIGDGANDVAMIQQAEVGVGISGREGLQAVNSSDFAIAQFRFLAPLLLAHGRWSYRRMAKVFLYSFFKNVVLTFTLFYYNLFTGWSGTSLYESLVYSGYNFFLGLPIVAIGIFDRDLSKDTCLNHPSMYMSGLHNMNLNMKKMAQWIIHALVLSAVVFWITWGAFSRYGVAWDPNGEMDGGSVAGLAVYSCLIFAMQIKVSEETATWCRWNWITMVISIVGYFVFVLVYNELYATSPEFYGVAVVLFSRGTFWLTLLLVCGIVLTVDFVAENIRRALFYTPVDVAMEIERCRSEEARSLLVWGDEPKQTTPKKDADGVVRVNVISRGSVVSSNPTVVLSYEPPVVGTTPPHSVRASPTTHRSDGSQRTNPATSPPVGGGRVQEFKQQRSSDMK